MKKICYYEFVGIEPHTFVGRELGHSDKFQSHLKAIYALESAIAKWKKSEVFSSAGILIDEVVCEDSVPFSYIHEFVFKGKVNGLYYLKKFEIVPHVVFLCDC